MNKTIVAKLNTPGEFISGILKDIVPAKTNMFIVKPTIILHDKENTIFFEIPQELQNIAWYAHLNQYVIIIRSYNLINELNRFVSTSYNIYIEPIEEVCINDLV